MRTRRTRMTQCKFCRAPISLKHLYCAPHWHALPDYLRRELVKAWSYGLAWKCHPTQDFLEAVRKANAYLAPPADLSPLDTQHPTRKEDYANVK